MSRALPGLPAMARHAWAAASGWAGAVWRGEAGALGLVCAHLLAAAAGGAAIALALRAGSLPASALAIALAGAVAGWAATGTLRGADTLLRGSTGLITGGLVLLSLLAASAYIGSRIVTLVSTHHLAPDLGAYVPPPLRVAVEDGGRRLHVSGVIDYELLEQVNAALAQGRAEQIVLSSEGGSIPAARALAQRIAARGLAAHVEALCASACTLVFMAGRERTLGPAGRLGFHGYGVMGFMRAGFNDIPAEEARDRAWLLARGLDPAFVERAYATPIDRIWMPTPEELLAAGALTSAPPQGLRHQTSGSQPSQSP